MVETWLVRNLRFVLGLIFVSAFVMRLGVALTYQGGISRALGGDEPLFDEFALALVSGQGFTNGVQYSTRAPLFSFFLAGIYALFGHSRLAVEIALALLGAATCLLIYLVARRHFSTTVAFLATFLSVPYPLFVDTGRKLLSENLFVPLLLFGVWCLLSLKNRPSLRAATVSGLVLGFGVLTRAALLAFVVLVPLWLVARAPSNRIHAGVLGIVVVMVAFLTILPWSLRNYEIHQRWVPVSTDGGITLLGCNNQFVMSDAQTRGSWAYWRNFDYEFTGLSEAASDAKAYTLAFDFIGNNLTSMPQLEVWKLIRWLYPFPTAPTMTSLIYFFPSTILIPMGLIGLAVSWMERNRPYLIYSLFAYFALITLVFCGESRLRLPIEPYLIILAAYALVSAIQRFRVVPQ